ncbi:Pycsar system effector family protein [Streptosporangium canum]|uniref:Pycsar system effector family protein n=1 Tax=Streptosporangium canum TaxID=324952 RepID=UPI00368DB756
MMPTTQSNSTPADLQVGSWRAVPLADPTTHPNGMWAIVSGDCARQDRPDLQIEITAAEHPGEVAAFLLAAARAYPTTKVAALQAEADAVRLELARVDVKATALLGMAGTMFAVLAAAVTVKLPPPAALISVALGAALLAAAIVMLLIVIRPALPRRGQGGTGFVTHADLTSPHELVATLVADPEHRLANEVLRLSSLARTKYTRLRRGVHLLLTALAFLLAALPLGALT